MKIGSNKNTNNVEAKFRSPVAKPEPYLMKRRDDKSIQVPSAAYFDHSKIILPVDNSEILGKQHNDERLQYLTQITETRPIPGKIS